MSSKLPIILILCLILIYPVSAAQYSKTNTIPWNTQEHSFHDVREVSYDASKDNQRLALVQIITPMDSTVSFTIYYGNGSTVSGSFQTSWIAGTVVPPTISRTTSTVTLNGVSKSYTFTDIQPVLEMDIVGYGTDTNVTPPQTGFLVYNVDYGLFDNDLAVFYPVNNIGVNTIYRVDASCSKPFTIIYRTGNSKEIGQGASKNVIDIVNEWIAYAISIAETVYTIVTTLYYWIKFFFWDNLGMTIALYLAITAAVAFNQCTDIWAGIKKFFKFQISLFTFILFLWDRFISLIATFRGIFRL